MLYTTEFTLIQMYLATHEEIPACALNWLILPLYIVYIYARAQSIMQVQFYINMSRSSSLMVIFPAKDQHYTSTA